VSIEKTLDSVNGAAPLSWTAAVQQVSTIAHAKLPPALHSRLEMATALVLDGKVWPEEDEQWWAVQATVRDPDALPTYFWVQETCPCPDALHKAPEGLCKHLLAVKLSRRASELAAPAPQSAALLPPDIPAEHCVLVHGVVYVRYIGLLALAHQRGLVSLKATFLSVTPELALATAEATFADGRIFTEAGDATPQNVTPQIRPHFARMALTRSKSRCLRDALNISQCSLEELGNEINEKEH
jgi:hypothetical protein